MERILETGLLNLELLRLSLVYFISDAEDFFAKHQVFSSDKYPSPKLHITMENKELDLERSGFEPWPGHCVVFLGKTLYSHSASLQPGV